jgi:hypothetical protein
MPVFWFSANSSGPESPEQIEIIRKCRVAILAWQFETQFAPAYRHGEDKLHAEAEVLAKAAPYTDVLIYVQGQLAIDWYESTRAMLPPPCGGDVNGAFKDFWLVQKDGTPAPWPSPARGCTDLNFNFSKPEVREYFVEHVGMPMATLPTAPNLKGVWFDGTDWLGCNDMCNEVVGHFWPCDSHAQEMLFNGTVAWKKDIAARLNARDQIPIFSSINQWNKPLGHGKHTAYENGKATTVYGKCPFTEREVGLELFPLSYGRFFEGFSGTCADIAEIQIEAESGLAVFVNSIGATLTEYTVAAFLMGAGNQSFLASSSCWTDPCTQWHPEFYDQKLGAPKELGYSDPASPTIWHREFAHATVDLNCHPEVPSAKIQWFG